MKKWILVAGGVLVAAAVFWGLASAYPSSETTSDTTSDETFDEISAENGPAEEPKVPEFVNLQPTLDAWLGTLNKKAAVALLIYDLDNEKVAAERNPDAQYSLASIYKLFFVYKAYERIEQGLDDGNARFADGKTRLQCLDKIIRESYNPCAEPLRAEMMGTIENVIKNEYKITNTSAGALYGSPRAVAEMLRIYFEHKELSEETYALIKDSMLNQPPTTYDWRRGLPAGFKVAKVYDKVGWNWVGSYWETYDDAAIVEFPEQGRHYIMVVLTGYIDYKDLARLGAALESAILAKS